MSVDLYASKSVEDKMGSPAEEEFKSCKNILNRTNLSKLHFNKNNVKTGSPSGKSLLKLKRLSNITEDHFAPIISPVSKLAMTFIEANLGTPTTSKLNVAEEKRDDYVRKLKGVEMKDKAKGTVSKRSSDNKDTAESSLISNNFALSSNNRNVLQSHHTDSRSYFVQRQLDDILEGTSSYDDMLYEKSNDMMPIDEVSFYPSSSPRSNSPQPCPIMDMAYLPPEGSPQRFTVVHDTVTIVDNDRLRDGSTTTIKTSADTTGYQKFRFVEPLPPKHSENRSPSPKDQYDQQKQQMRKSPKNNFRIFNSLSSGSTESMEDDYLELFDMEPLEDEANFPTDLNSLISGDIKNVKTTPETKRPVVRRCLSLTDSNEKFRARSLVFEAKTSEVLKSIDENSPRSTLISERCFKRPEPPTNNSPIQCKRYKLDVDEKENSISNLQRFQQESGVARPILRKSISLNDAQIMTALARSSSESDLIGDFSKPFCLPLTDGRHQDLKSISVDTMAKLIRGEFSENVASFHVIDCRYPYEFDGGHITGARNIFTHEQILKELVNCKTETPTVQADGPKRHILVFHCEFSSERGPKLSRFLRNNDRQRNTNTYPALHYPEIYLLHGGYKEFFEKYSELCDPVAYRPMLHPNYVDDYRQCRAKSKSWSGDIKSSASTNRLMKSRSRLVL